MITPKTIAQFLFGKREAIEKIASGKHTLLLGLLFIVSAGLARNYDHHLLHKELLWIGGPIGMTLLSSIVIYGFVKIFGNLERKTCTFRNYLPFLRCFAMTAPLAWLYGIPIEQYADSLNSTIFNFIVLLIVSFWRVALMIRVIQVLFNFQALRAFSLIAIPASIEMFFATNLKAIDIVGIMGGMRLTESEEFLLAATHTMVLGSIVLFLVALPLSFTLKRGDVRTNPVIQKTKIPTFTWIIPIFAISSWGLAARTPQIRLSNLQDFQDLIRQEDYALAARFADSKSKAGFPPHRRLLSKTTFYSSPEAALCLASYKDWPIWLDEEFALEVSSWLKPSRKDDFRRRRDLQTLYRDLEGSPFLEEFALQFTPDFDPSDYFPEKNEVTTPTP